MERPVFLFATGWRTGSTLVQRLLSSHPDVLIWGENRGVVDHLSRACQTIDELQALSDEHRKNFESDSLGGWIAMLNPPQSSMKEGVRRLLEAYFRDPALKRGRCRWGFKEVRHGRDTAAFLMDLYPNARFILLTRHPQDTLASARGPVRGDEPVEGSILAEAGGPRQFLEHWAMLAEDFSGDWKGIPHLLLKYENVVDDPEQAIDEISHLLDVDPSDFDRSVFKKRARGFHHPSRLERGDRLWLESPWLWEAAEYLGYEPRPRESVRGRTKQWLDSVVASLQPRRREIG